MFQRLHHVGIAVKDLEATLAFYRDVLGFPCVFREPSAAGDVETAGVRAGDTLVEFVAPLTPEGPLASFLATRGEGLHHTAYQVADIRQAIAWCKAQGFRMIDEEPRPGSHHTLIAFVHPASTHRVLLELVQAQERPQP
jgi:methylmalonyl-CoA/ethylmalonyl-CoA epimerase